MGDGVGVPRSPVDPAETRLYPLAFMIKEPLGLLGRGCRLLRSRQILAGGGQAARLPRLTSILRRAEGGGWSNGWTGSKSRTCMAQSSSSSDPTASSCMDVVYVHTHTHK